MLTVYFDYGRVAIRGYIVMGASKRLLWEQLSLW
jgi:hypothetical protein